MPVEQPRKSYKAFEPKWTRCRDTFDGQDAIKAATTRYLPLLDSQADKQGLYQAYLARALYYNAMARTVSGLAGAVFRKDPTIAFPETLQPQLDDITLTSQGLDGFSLMVFEEVLKIGRAGILVEMPREEDIAAGTSPLGTDETIRPYWVLYKAEEIINWATTRVGGRQILSMVVIKESRETAKQGDPFTPVEIERYRVLKLEADTGAYVIDIWERDDKSKKVEFVETIRPIRRGEPMKQIPFVFLGPTHLSVEPEKPPLLDVADVNISHYQSSADLEHGRHFVGLPQPWISGGKSGANLPIGSGVAWVLPDAQSRAGMLEFSGQGLGSLEKALEDKRNMMATLGARILEVQKRVGEAAESIKLRTAGEQSVLRTIAFTADRGISTALRFHADWAGATQVDEDTVRLETNKDFVESRLPSEDLKTLLLMLQDGRISEETFYYNLERGEITVPGRTLEDERAAIAEEEARNIANRPQLPEAMRGQMGNPETLPPGNNQNQPPGGLQGGNAGDEGE